MLKRVKNQKGFTLIELVAVIAILGILALLIVPRVSNYTTSAKVSKAKGNLTVLKNAIERYNSEHNAQLNTLGTTHSIDEAAVQDALTKTSSGVNGTVGPYLSSIPTEFNVAANTIDKIMAADPNSINSASFDASLTTITF